MRHKPFKEEALFDALVQHLDADFDYEDDELPAHAGAPNLEGVPQMLRARLLGALERLDVRDVEAAIEAVSQVDAQAAHGLSAMASPYEYEGISALLKTGSETLLQRHASFGGRPLRAHSRMRKSARAALHASLSTSPARGT